MEIEDDEWLFFLNFPDVSMSFLNGGILNYEQYVFADREGKGGELARCDS